ncbi:hypothetical protein SAMN05216565_105188 [Litchfieldia salsa]|uniref:Uncharacterized protein n=1 Tax=Litchfieldia salsa TaxID=930152 RepID=A0A1H0UV09_9BACI|nr:hypothetical protein SAMN05216565_105188 [Litchfieldia salsa]
MSVTLSGCRELKDNLRWDSYKFTAKPVVIPQVFIYFYIDNDQKMPYS